jgi:hypothetical protein
MTFVSYVLGTSKILLSTLQTPILRLKVHPLLKNGKPLQIWFIFSLQDVLERKKIQIWQEKSDEVGPVSPQSDTCFWSKIGHF